MPPPPSRLPTLLGPVTWSQSPLAFIIPLPFLAHSSLTGQHHERFNHPTYLLTQHSQSLITVWPTISFFTCPSFFTLIHPRIFAFLYSIHLSTHLPIYPLTHTSRPHNPPLSSSTSHQQIQTRTCEDVLLEIFATARDSFPFVASTAPGQDPLVAGLLFSSCRIRALTSFFIPCRWMRQWSDSSFACLVRVKWRRVLSVRGCRTTMSTRPPICSPVVCWCSIGVVFKGIYLSLCEYTYMLCVLYLRNLFEPEVSG